MRKRVTGQSVFPDSEDDGCASADACAMKRCATFWGLVTAYWLSERWREAWTPERDRPGDHLAAQQGRRLDGHGQRRLHRLARRVPPPRRGRSRPCHPPLGARLFRHLGLPLRRPRDPPPRFDDAPPSGAPLADRPLRRRDPLRPAHRLRPDERPRREARALPDSIDQRLDTCTDHLYGGLIGLVMGFFGAVASIWFVSAALIERSQPVALPRQAGASANGLVERLLGPGDRGTRSTSCRATTARRSSPAVLVALYIPAVTFFAWRVGRVVQQRTLERQKQRRRLARRARLDAQPRRPRRRLVRPCRAARHKCRLYAGIDHAWRRQNVWVAGDADVHRGLHLPVAARARLPAGAAAPSWPAA